MEMPHTNRMALMLALMLVLLVAVAVGKITGGGGEQQAAVLRAYAQ